MKYVRPWNLFIDLHRSKALRRGGRFLGLDVGDKYVGLAVSDPTNRIASPLSVLLRNKQTLELMAADFNNLVSERSLVGFVVGYPFHQLRGNRDAVQVKLLIDDLCRTRKLEGVKYTYWDEGFTSKNLKIHVLDAECGITVKAFDFASGAAKNNYGQVCCCWYTPGVLGLCEPEGGLGPRVMTFAELLTKKLVGKDDDSFDR